MKNIWSVKKIGEAIKSIAVDSQLAPIISGGASLLLLDRIIFSNLENYKFIWSLIIVVFLFIASAVLYFFLRKIEKDKDEYMLSVIGRTVGDVFKRYGQQMAKSNADHAKAEDMNKIMQTIVNLVAGLKSLGDKKYKN